MIHDTPIRSIMTANPETVDVGAKLSEVRRLIAEKWFHHVPVVDGRRLVGLLTATDMVRLSISAYGADEATVDAMIDAQFSIQQVMTTGLFTLQPDETVHHAADKLRGGQFHCLPVVDGEQNLLGIVTTTDLVQYLFDQG